MAKTARKIELVENQVIDFKTFKDYNDHAYNSSVWYLEKYTQTSFKVKQRLYKKGYPKGNIKIKKKNNKIYTYNIVDKTIQRLEKEGYLNDDDYTSRFIYRKLAQGNGLTKIKAELLKNGITSDRIEKILQEEDLDSEKDYALDKEFNRVISSSTVRKIEEEYAQKQKIIQTLVRKGFSLDDIFSKIEEHYGE